MKASLFHRNKYFIFISLNPFEYNRVHAPTRSEWEDHNCRVARWVTGSSLKTLDAARRSKVSISTVVILYTLPSGPWYTLRGWLGEEFVRRLWRAKILRKLETKQRFVLSWLRVKSFHSPFSPFFCSSNRSLIFSTNVGLAKAWANVRGDELMVKHRTSFKVNA